MPYFPLLDARQGIVHIIGPEQGISLPGMTIVCGDSHTSTHGALGALAFGIGTSEVEHVLATQTLLQKPAKNMLVRVDGALPLGVTAKDLVLAIIGRIGTAGGTGHVIEYAGEAIRALDMAGRMTVCNMSIEAGARAGLIAPDETTFDYIRGRPYAPQGRGVRARGRVLAHAAVRSRRALRHDGRRLDAAEIAPMVTWGTSPEAVVPITGAVPDPDAVADEARAGADAAHAGLHGLTPGQQHDGHAGRRRVHRQLHQRPDRGHPRGRRASRAGRQRGRRRAGDGGAGLRPGEAAGRGRGAGPRAHRRRLRVARGGLLDVPRHEPRQADARPALRQHVEPQFRGPAGAGRADASAVARDGGGGGGDRPSGRRAGVRS